MREIKFRAWDKFQKKMINDFLIEKWKIRLGITFNGGVFNFTDSKSVDFDEEEMFNSAEYIDRFVLEQYTMLNDKNGIEIYNGDIVDDSYVSKLTEKLVVQRYIINLHENGLYGMEYIGEEKGFDRFLFMKNKDVEVVGNIHE